LPTVVGLAGPDGLKKCRIRVKCTGMRIAL
jgi:hypothetical protein